VIDALEWLTVNNPLYGEIEPNEENIRALPDNGIPNTLYDAISVGEDKLAHDTEHTGYTAPDLVEAELDDDDIGFCTEENDDVGLRLLQKPQPLDSMGSPLDSHQQPVPGVNSDEDVYIIEGESSGMADTNGSEVRVAERQLNAFCALFNHDDAEVVHGDQELADKSEPDTVLQIGHKPTPLLEIILNRELVTVCQEHR